jgi:peptide/nickel transport system substrate-binding protein
MWEILIFQTKTIAIPVASNRYYEGIVGQPIAVNPVVFKTNDADRDLVELLFSSLLDLAESYKMDATGQVWNIVLKSDLRWSDSKPLTSDDVIFTIDTIQNLNIRSPLFLMWQGVIADRVSEREIEFTLRTPYAFFLDNLRELKPIPKHIFGIIPAENFHLSNFNLEPVGSGPYKFISLAKKKGGFITEYRLATNEYYALEKPFIKEFIVKFYPNSAELLAAFNLKEIDGFGGLNTKNIEDLRLGHTILEKMIPHYFAIFINKSADPSLEDDDVIAALTLAVNKQAIIEQVFDKRAIIANLPILPMIEGYDESIDPGNEFSPEKAGDLLDKAGWKLNSETGIREKKIKKENKPLEYSIIVPQISFLAETIDIIKKDWAEIGVKLNPIILNPADIANEVLKTRNYQMIIFGNVLRNNPDLFSFWHSSESFYPGLNLSLYNNKKVDALLESIRKNFDKKSRKEDLSRLQKLITSDKPAIFLYSPTYLYVGPKDFGGFKEKTLVTPSDRFKNVNKWYLETTRVFK